MLATSEPARGPSNKAQNERSDIDSARSRLGESIEKAINLSHHLMDRLESVLAPAAPTNVSAAMAVASARTPLANELHDMATQLNAANDRLCDLLDRLGL